MGVKAKKQKKTDQSIRHEIISRGGHVTKDLEKKVNYTYCLNLPQRLNIEIMDKLKDRLGLSKNAWILEAIQEKLKRENEMDKC
jgi:hypothetical protein